MTTHMITPPLLEDIGRAIIPRLGAMHMPSSVLEPAANSGPAATSTSWSTSAALIITNRVTTIIEEFTNIIE